jgi:hypothetical protein
MPDFNQMIIMTNSNDASCKSRCSDHCPDETGDEDNCCEYGRHHIGKTALSASAFLNDPNVEVM